MRMHLIVHKPFTENTTAINSSIHTRAYATRYTLNIKGTHQAQELNRYKGIKLPQSHQSPHIFILNVADYMIFNY